MASARQGGHFQLLYELGQAFATHLDVGELVPSIITKCREVFAADGVSVLLLDDARHELYFPYVSSDPDVAERLAHVRLPAREGIAGEVLESGTPVWVPDVQHHPRFCQVVDRTTGITTRCLLGAPLASHGRPIGVLEVVNPRIEGDGTEDLALLGGLAASIAVAFENARLYAAATTAAEQLRTEVGVLRRDLARQGAFAEIVGRSPPMVELLRLVEAAAASAVTVLIEGETGTGKELVARALHRAGARARGPFIALNCAALPEALLESELFGHRRGAFTGALQDRPGLVEAADGGTLFLDEVGEMPLPMQAKLLRVLEEGEVLPIGGHQARRVDVRVVAATNRDLVAEMQRHAFREDLYYRLATFPIMIPPLRERPDDVPLLVEHLVGVAARSQQKRIAGIDPRAVDRLVRFPWPGNVRELRNELARAVTLTADGETIGLPQLSARVVHGEGSSPSATVASEGDIDPAAPHGLREARTAFEVRYVARALRLHGHNVTRAARALGLSRVMLQKKMKEYGLRGPDTARTGP